MALEHPPSRTPATPQSSELACTVYFVPPSPAPTTAACSLAPSSPSPERSAAAEASWNPSWRPPAWPGDPAALWQCSSGAQEGALWSMGGQHYCGLPASSGMSFFDAADDAAWGLLMHHEAQPHLSQPLASGTHASNTSVPQHPPLLQAEGHTPWADVEAVVVNSGEECMMRDVAGQPRGRFGPLGANLFVFYLPSSWKSKHLAKAFRPFGRVVSAKVYEERPGGRSRGFGFVCFDKPLAAARAIAVLNGQHVGEGKRLRVQSKRGEGGYLRAALEAEGLGSAIPVCGSSAQPPCPPAVPPAPPTQTGV